LTFAFHELGLHRVSLRVFSFNDRAIALDHRLGFREEGRIREGQWHDTIIMSILEEAFTPPAKSKTQ